MWYFMNLFVLWIQFQKPKSIGHKGEDFIKVMVGFKELCGYILDYNVFDYVKIHFQKPRGVFYTPPNSLWDLNVGAKVKHWKRNESGHAL
jgi:hypothetical protein